MADYRELLRKAIDALPENTGANRRAVYEKARTALVAQLRAIEPPLPAREITTHRLALEDCIREVEHEATEKLLGRFRAVEEEPEDEVLPVAAPVEPESEPEPEVEPSFEPDFSGEPEEEAPLEDSQPEGEDNPIVDAPTDPLLEDDAIAPFVDEIEDDRLGEQAPTFVTDQDVEPEAPQSLEQDPDERLETEAPQEPVVSDWDTEPRQDVDTPADEPSAGTDEDRIERAVTSDADFAFAAANDVGADDVAQTSQDHPVRQEDEPGIGALYAPGSIEDIIASAEKASTEPEAAESNRSDDDEDRVIPFSSPYHRSEPETHEERHFLTSEAEAEPPTSVPLVDVHGHPLGHDAEAPAAAAEPGTAMSSVREVDLEPGILNRPEISDAQVAIDRAIAALDREARGDNESAQPDAEAEQATDQAVPAEDETRSGGGPGAFTIFLVIAVLLLGGGGAAGFWAWREGYIDLNAVFAQGEPEQETTEVAQAETPEDPEAVAPEEPAEPEATNTTPEVPALSGEIGGTTMPGEELPSTETETPSNTQGEPEVSFEDRLPAEADTPVEPTEDMLEQPDIALNAEGPQSLLLEEQSGGTTGAVPYSGSVEWSRGTDELGNPTIVAQASIPARNLEVDVLLRRNADDNLPASHLMEINFTVSDSFIGGSIANLPGVLLKDEELVQGQPLTGASARIVGNSFLFALSSASDIDVENNIELLTERSWVDLAMVYGTGRRAILTLEKGEDGAAIFDDVLADWADLDAAAPDGEDAEGTAADAAEAAAGA